MYRSLIFLMGCGLAHGTFSQEEAVDKSELRHSWFFTLGNTSIDSATARGEGIEDSAFALRFGWAGSKAFYRFTGGMNYVSYSDNESFSQLTEDLFGDEDVSDSEASALSLFGEFGVGHEFQSGIDLSLLAGYDVQISSERSIPNCSNCFEEDIDLDSGLYLKPSVTYFASNGFNIGLGFVNYLSGDYESNIELSIGFRR